MGSLSILRNLLFFSMYVWCLVKYDVFVKELEHIQNTQGTKFNPLTHDIHNLFRRYDWHKLEHPAKTDIPKVVKIVFGLQIFYCVLEIICAVLLVYGKMKSRLSFMTPWIVVGLMNLIIMFLSIGLQGFLLSLILLALGLYFWAFEYAVYKDLEDEEGPLHA